MSEKLIPRDSVVAMLAEIHAAQKEVEQAFELLITAKSRLHKTLGAYRDYVLPQNFVSENSLDKAKSSAIDRIERNAWEAIIERLNVKEIISVSKRNEVEKQLADGALPPLTVEAVFAFMNQIFAEMPSLLEDSAKEVFDWLRPPSKTPLKTNEKNRFGLKSKVILKLVMEDNKWGRRVDMPRRVDYSFDQHFHAMDNVFHLLDGKGVSKYPNDIVTMISEAGNRGESYVQTEYFEIKWFLNRNMHIAFRRSDLVRKLNAFAGRNRLKGDEPHAEA